MRRKTLVSALSIAAAGLLLTVGTVGANGKHEDKVRGDLTGFQEVPVVITTGNGELKLTINESARTIDYVLTFADLQADITQAHIHVAQKSVNGAIVLWLCQTPVIPAPGALGAITPFCYATAGNTPRAGRVTGTLRDVNAVGSATQQLAAGSLDDAFIAIAAGKAYGNVHTVASPGGEIRGQLNDKHKHH